MIRSWLGRRLSAVVRSREPSVRADDEDPLLETRRLLHKEVKERAARLDAASARLDTKSATLLGFVSAVCIFLAGQNVPGWWKALAYAAWAGTVTSGLLAMRVRRWREAPEPEALHLLAERTEMDTLRLLTEAQTRVFTANRLLHERKATFWQASMVFLIVAVLLTALALMQGGSSGRKQGEPGRGTSGSPAPSGSPASSASR